MAIGNYHQFTRNLHLQYGPVVRIGYNKVSVSDPLELKHILSTHEFRKGSFYKAMEKVFPSTFTTTNPGFNKTRRRQLGNSYSLPSVRLYESKIFEHGVLSLISLWDSQISLSPGRDRAIVNFHYGFHGLAFDIIGVLGFGKSFNILSTGDTKIINNVGKFVKLGAITSGMPLGKYLEWFLGDWVDAGKYVLTVIDDTIRSRKQENAESAASDHGTELCVSLFACHRNQDVWPSPDEFDPERFMGPDAERRIKDVLAFGSGVRICIGRYLGLVELYTTLANLVRRYDFKLPDAEERRYDFSAGEIPGKSFFIYTPTNADKNCQMVVSPAK
ncbi:hypothetical protein EV175_003733 [Coemansia sp. RSA 1933]|nr:hypothetical protein EV175_003733 [Coemansia sp. RSA 1933]